MRISFRRIPFLSFIPLLILAISAACLKSPSEPAVQEPASITLSSYSLVLTSIGQRVLINATVLDQDSRVIADATIFFRSSNEKIATVGNTGLVTAVSMGSTQITVTSGYATASATVTVMQEAGSITISPPSATLTTVGETVQLTAEVEDTGKTVIPGAAVMWSSSDPEVATVDANGLVTALSIGTTRIMATSAGVSKSSTVYVEIPKPAARIDLNISQATLTSVGQSLKLDALVYDIDGVAIPDAPVAWSSSHPEVAAVDTTGLVSAVDNGTTLVTATSGGITTFATIHVVIEGTVPPPPPPPVAARIEISPPSATLTEMGETLQLTATVYDTNDEIIAGAPVVWSSSDPAVATVDADGLATAVSNGNTQITATSDGVSTFATIDVEIEEPEPPPPPESSPDRDALIAFYNATGGSNWTNNTNWLSDEPLEEWHGVITDAGGRVTTLQLSENNLVGTIPTELEELTELRHLNVNFNNLNGSIPKELGQLAHLRYLQLDGNELTGTIPPELGELTKLETMDLENNALTGSIPSELGQLTDLGWLLINHNELTGSIPPELGALAELTILGAAENQLSGSIPPELGNLSKLKNLELLSNGLNGDIPPELGRLINLERLYLGENKLQGEVPSELGDLTNLKTLDLQQNTGLTGPLPLSLTGVSLTELRLNSTKLCVPSGAVFQAWLVGIGTKTGIRNCEEESEDLEALTAFFNATDGPDWTINTNWLSDEPLGEWYGVTTNASERVVELNLGRNNLTGSLPSSMDRLSQLRVIHLFENNLNGSIPTSLGKLSELRELWLQNNELSGAIPSSMANLSKLQELLLDDNELSGTIPESLGNLSNLRILKIPDNRLSGTIPSTLGNLQNMDLLELQQNELTGTIPPSLGELSNVTILRLEENSLIGFIPPSLGNLSKLEQLALWDNELTGNIPSSLGNLTELQSLSLHKNKLSGPIHPELGQLTRLESLYLSTNAELAGPLPHELTGLPLSLLWLDGTQLCVPDEPDFMAWLESIELKEGIMFCENVPEESDDRAALTAFYHATDGPNWTDKTNWLSEEPIGTWYGVNTDGDGRVTDLRLYQNNLSGEIPPEIGDFSVLEQLELYENQLSGAIPPEIGNLGKLRDLFLSGNRLSGSIPPDIGDLTGLVQLWLNNNQLSGEIPPRVGNMSALQALLLDYNQLSGGIPPELGKMKNLGYLTLSNNANLSGPLPIEMTAISSMRSLVLDGTMLCVPSGAVFQAWLDGINEKRGVMTCSDQKEHVADREALIAFYNATGGPDWTNNTNWLSDEPYWTWIGVSADSVGRVSTLFLRENNLTGSLPPDLGQLQRLQTLDLGRNNLNGHIPSEIGLLLHLRFFDLSFNSLTGSIPADIVQLKNLQLIQLGENKLTGTIPTDIGKLQSLQLIQLDVNDLSGHIPPGIGQLQSLQILELGGNNLEGQIPPELGLLQNLRVLDLFRNQLTGDIPPAFGQLSALENLRLGRNQLTGEIPTEISGLNSLLSLSLGANQLSGEIPSEIGQLGNLRVLLLHYNQLTGEIPSQIGNLVELRLLWAGNNQLSGEIPPEIGNLVALEDLFLTENQLSGEIPSEIGNLVKLVHLNLQQNRLSGEIPPEIGNLTALRNLSLLDNQFSGEIPPEIGNLESLERLSIHQNELSGEIPPEIGNLVKLVELSLYDNQLSRGIPSEIGEIVTLEELLLENNEAMSGALPIELTAIANLRYLHLEGTQLCVPDDPTFLAWLEGILSTTGIRSCNDLPEPTDDREAMIWFYNATGGSNWTNDANWKRNVALAEWHGVETDNDGNVTELRLAGNNLSGSIPPEIGQIDRLHYLDLRNNGNLSGPLPTEITSLSLRTLFMSGTTACAPGNDAFDEWLDSIENRKVDRCGNP